MLQDITPGLTMKYIDGEWRVNPSLQGARDAANAYAEFRLRP